MKEGKAQAQTLRKRGYSLKEIAQLVGISKSTAANWTKDVKLSVSAQHRVRSLFKNGQARGLNSIHKKRDRLFSDSNQTAQQTLESVVGSKQLSRVFCALLYWCEGSKQSSPLTFTNSDPVLVRTFLKLLRDGFNLDESKFRVCLHLHSYHNEKQQKDFWSKATGIPETQFIKIYKKLNSGKRKRVDYPGCVSIRYHDYKVLMVLRAVYKMFGKKYGRVV